MTAPLPDAVGVVERLKTMDAVRESATVDWARGLLEKRRAELALHHQRFPYTIDKSMAETAIAIELMQAHDQSQAARIAELEAGLKPFAAWAVSFDGDAVEYPAPDSICLAIRHNPSHKTKLTVADLRQARSLLSEGEGRGDYAASGSVPSRGSDAPAAPGEVGP